jgi:hypothetical protein
MVIKLLATAAHPVASCHENPSLKLEISTSESRLNPSRDAVLMFMEYSIPKSDDDH